MVESIGRDGYGCVLPTVRIKDGRLLMRYDFMLDVEKLPIADVATMRGSHLLKWATLFARTDSFALAYWPVAVRCAEWLRIAKESTFTQERTMLVRIEIPITQEKA